jgi:hypothetical protein
MKRVIDISEDAYELLLEKGTCGKFANLGEIVANSTPIEQEPTSYQWCTDCKEYDQEKHCCHRWSKVIRNTVEEMKQEPILDELRAEITTLQNRCYALTKGAVCRFCKYECEHKAESEET